MKILGFNASPRKEGNTAWTVRKILEGATEQGAQTQFWSSSDLKINPCKGCLACVQSEQCTIKDDMQEIYGALEQADALVLGSPVYMGQMSAQAKIFTDRLFAQITPRFSPKFKEKNAGKKLLLAFTQGNPNPEMFQAYYDYTQHIFKLLEFVVEDVFVVTGTRSVPAHEKKDLHVAAKEVGSSLVLKRSL